jgi:hypothetical protein
VALLDDDHPVASPMIPPATLAMAPSVSRVIPFAHPNGYSGILGTRWGGPRNGQTNGGSSESQSKKTHLLFSQVVMIVFTMLQKVAGSEQCDERPFRPEQNRHWILTGYSG